MGAGRPTTYSDERHEAICKSLEAGMSRTTAAELIGINRSTLESWREKYPAFNHDVRMAMAKAKRRASLVIARSIAEGDVASAWRYLAMQEREEWREQNDLNINHSGTVNHNHRDASAFTDAEIEALAAIAERRKAGELAS